MHSLARPTSLTCRCEGGCAEAGSNASGDATTGPIATGSTQRAEATAPSSPHTKWSLRKLRCDSIRHHYHLMPPAALLTGRAARRPVARCDCDHPGNIRQGGVASFKVRSASTSREMAPVPEKELCPGCGGCWGIAAGCAGCGPGSEPGDGAADGWAAGILQIDKHEWTTSLNACYQNRAPRPTPDPKPGEWNLKIEAAHQDDYLLLRSQCAPYSFPAPPGADFSSNAVVAHEFGKNFEWGLARILSPLRVLCDVAIEQVFFAHARVR